MNRKSISVQ